MNDVTQTLSDDENAANKDGAARGADTISTLVEAIEPPPIYVRFARRKFDSVEGGPLEEWMAFPVPPETEDAASGTPTEDIVAETAEIEVAPTGDAIETPVAPTSDALTIPEPIPSTPSGLPMPSPGADLPRPSLRKLWIGLCLGFTFLFYAAQVPNFLNYSSPPTGDQPFYLMVTISLVQDGDLDLANNYAAQDENKFYALAPRPEGFVGMAAPYPLPPHPAYTPARPPTEQYNFHLPGLSLMLAPAWVIGGWFSLWWPATVVLMCFIGALVALNIFMLAHEMTGKLWIAAAVWAVTAFSNPLMTYSYMIFTELTCGLLAIYAFRRLAMGWAANGPWRLLLIGVCIGYIPWVAWRCLFITIPLAIYAAVQWWRAWRASRTTDGGQLEPEGETATNTEHPPSAVRRPSSARRALSTLYIFIPMLISAIGLAWYNLTLFGSLVPTIRTSEMGDQPLFFWPWTGIEGLTQFSEAGFGFLFDRMYGLLVYAPVYLLAAVGMIAMFRSARRSDRRLLLSIVLVLGPYLGLMMSFFYWNGLWCPPARFMTTFAPFMAAPLAMSLYALRYSWTYKILYVLLAIPGWISMAIMMRDARRMWPGYPVYEWLATAPEAPVRVNLTNVLPAIDPLDDRRLPANLAWIAAVAVGIVLFSYLLMLWWERSSKKPREVRVERKHNLWPRRRWPLMAHGLTWLVAIAVISSGWYVLNREYIKPKTQLVEQVRWILSPPVNSPVGMALLDNKIYIAGYGEYGGSSLSELDLSTGAHRIIQPVTPGGTPLAFFHPGDIKLGPDPDNVNGPNNLLYVLNNGPGEQALWIMRPDGQVVRQVTLNSKAPIAIGLDFGPDGKLYVGDMTGATVRKYEMGGGDPIANWGGMSGGFNNVGGIAVDEDGTIYATEISFQRVQKLGPDGSFIQKYDLQCSPHSITINGDWVDVTCDKGLRSINKKTGAVQQSIVVEEKPQLDKPTGITYGPDNTLYIVQGTMLVSYKVQH